MIRVRSVGPIYWGLDTEHKQEARSSYAWVVETTPPYRKSRWGHLFAIGHHAVHFGIVTKEKDPKEIARWEGEGIDVTPEDIREWRGPKGTGPWEEPRLEDLDAEWQDYQNYLDGK